MLNEQTNQNSTKEWYYLKNNDRLGPFNEREIESFINVGSILKGTQVWKEGLSTWTKIEETVLNKYFATNLPPTPPIPPAPPKLTTTGPNFSFATYHKQKLIIIALALIGILSLYLSWYDLKVIDYYGPVSFSINAFGTVSGEIEPEIQRKLNNNFFLPYVLLGMFVGIIGKTVIGNVSSPHPKKYTIGASFLILVVFIIQIFVFFDSYSFPRMVHDTPGIGLVIALITSAGFIVTAFVFKEK